MVATPKRRFEYNLNTLVILFGFAGGLVAWGATWERVNANWNSQANSIDRLDKQLTGAEVSLRQVDNHGCEYRRWRSRRPKRRRR